MVVYIGSSPRKVPVDEWGSKIGKGRKPIKGGYIEQGTTVAAEAQSCWRTLGNCRTHIQVCHLRGMKTGVFTLNSNLSLAEGYSWRHHWPPHGSSTENLKRKSFGA